MCEYIKKENRCKNNFNLIAKAYHENTKNIPEEYINKLNQIFNLKEHSKIIDVGCGSGTITIPLSEKCDYVDGIDLSNVMIEIAKSIDTNKKVNWIVADILEYKLNNDYYDLIIAYESIHLFPDPYILFDKLVASLKKHGFLVIGYCVYNWEYLMCDDIAYLLAKNGIILEDWFFQCFKTFEEIISHHIEMAQTKSVYVEVEEEWSAIEIAKFITSTSLFISIDEKEKNRISKILEDTIVKKYGRVFVGTSKYYFRYSKKQG